MAISHICINCAKDLARQPAIFDPHYSLPLVICPDCNKASVRRPNYYSIKYKSLLRIITVFSTLLFQTLCIIALAGATVACVFLIGNVVFLMTDAELSRLSVTNVIIAVSLTSIATGAWLTAGFSHIPKLKVWIGWSVFLVMVTAIASIIYFLSKSNIDANFGSATILLVLANTLALIPILVMMILAMVGIPLGNFFLYLYQILARELWQWRKRRLSLGRTR
ncbi:MAG: hypothetical protein IH984_03875 [Planctomycetes bacterium]|nr:hypothetical protein [Planctomycetota bacterium]